MLAFVKKKWKWFVLGLVAPGFSLVLAWAVTWHFISSGGLIARQKPPAWETSLAGHILDLSVPDSARKLKNPLNPAVDGADSESGRLLYQLDCQSCHGCDGKGKTSAGSGFYPPPLDLSRDALESRGRMDGELFYFIRNGIRNTAMPGWQLPDREIWQIIVYIHNLPLTVAPDSKARSATARRLSATAHYVGSKACANCHAQIYNHWAKSLMANVVRDPRVHPGALVADFTASNNLVTFSTNDIALVYGSKWKQRYFKRIGADYYPLPAQWDITHALWRPYFARDDWWAPLYPPDNFKRPTGPTCDGCHSVNYDVQAKTVTEWNVGCEACHGPGSEHVRNPVDATIINPERLNFVQANDTCIQCHSQGRPVANPVNGMYYDWPVGFHMGEKLSDFWKLEAHKLGTTTFTHFPDGTAHKNRMQGNDFVLSHMYIHGVTCFTCHDPHGSDQAALLRKPASVLCLDCHGPGSPNGPHALTLQAHTHHKPGSKGSDCIACHMPPIAQTIADVNVRSHTFRFITPADSENLGIPNACNLCHKDKTTKWAEEALNNWNGVSPWRMNN